MPSEKKKSVLHRKMEEEIIKEHKNIKREESWLLRNNIKADRKLINKEKQKVECSRIRYWKCLKKMKFKSGIGHQADLSHKKEGN